jgi:hypothetical protein
MAGPEHGREPETCLPHREACRFATALVAMSLMNEMTRADSESVSRCENG